MYVKLLNGYRQVRYLRYPASPQSHIAQVGAMWDHALYVLANFLYCYT